MSTLSIIVIVVQLATSIWVLVDANTIGLNKQAKYGHFTRMRDTGPVGWFVACLLLWVICFPLYLIRRGKHLAKVKNDALGNRGVVSAQCPSCGLALSITPDLFGQVIVCPTCQSQFAAPQPYNQSWYQGAGPVAVGYVVYAVGLVCLVFAFLGAGAMTREQLEGEVKNNIQETFLKHADTIGTTIKSFSLVHESGTKYKGMLTAQTGDKSETAEVDVTYDGRTFMWKIVPNTAQASADSPPDSAPASNDTAKQPTRASAEAIAAITRVVRTDIENTFRDNGQPIPRILDLTIKHVRGNEYKGACALDFQNGKQPLNHDLVITYDGKHIECQMDGALDMNSMDVGPQQSSAGAQPINRSGRLEWNTHDIDAMQNGNVPVAVQTVMTNPDVRSGAIQVEPASVAKAPWNYYGKPITLWGTVAVVQDLPPNGDMSAILKVNNASDIVIQCNDGTVVEIFCMKSSGTIKVGNNVRLYGYAVGVTEVENRLGGKDPHLMLVGNDYKQL